MVSSVWNWAGRVSRLKSILFFILFFSEEFINLLLLMETVENCVLPELGGSKSSTKYYQMIDMMTQGVQDI